MCDVRAAARVRHSCKSCSRGCSKHQTSARVQKARGDVRRDALGSVLKVVPGDADKPITRLPGTGVLGDRRVVCVGVGVDGGWRGEGMAEE